MEAGYTSTFAQGPEIFQLFMEVTSPLLTLLISHSHQASLEVLFYFSAPLNFSSHFHICSSFPRFLLVNFYRACDAGLSVVGSRTGIFSEQLMKRPRACSSQHLRCIQHADALRRTNPLMLRQTGEIMHSAFVFCVCFFVVVVFSQRPPSNTFPRKPPTEVFSE